MSGVAAPVKDSLTAGSTTEESSVVPAKLASFIATRDRRIASFWPHSPNYLRNLFEELERHGCVRVGGRSTCGGSDPTMSALRMWNEVIRKAKTIGYPITETNVHAHGNAWATRGGGFWNETEYRLARVQGGQS